MNKRTRAAIVAVALPIALWASPALAQEYPPTAPPPAPPAAPPQAGPTELPRTGNDTGLLVLLGGATLAAGGAMVLASRRRA